MIYDKGKRLIAAAICALLLFSAMPFQMVSASDIQDNQNDQTNVETQQQGNTTQKDTEQVEVSNDNQDLIEGNENAQMPKDSQKDFECPRDCPSEDAVTARTTKIYGTMGQSISIEV